MSTLLLNVFGKARLTIVLPALCVYLLSGCSTIQFVQHEQPGEHTVVNRWHHATLNGMVELSKPLDVRSVCGKKAWTTITTEFTFYNALPELIVPSLSFVSFYSAWTNKVQCYEPTVE